MVDKKNLNRVKGILSAKTGAEIPKFLNSGKITRQHKTNGSYIYSKDGNLWYLDELYNLLFTGNLNDYNEPISEDSNTLNVRIVNDQKSPVITNTSVNGKINSEDSDSKENDELNGGLSPNETTSTTTNSAGINTTQVDQLSKAEKRKLWWGNAGIQTGKLATEAFQGIGKAVGAKQMTTDSNTTKTADALYDTMSEGVKKLGPVGEFAGILTDNLAIAGDIAQELGGGTDLQTKTDQWMDSSFFSWNVGLINGFWGQNSDKFGIDHDTMNKVGSSYGGFVNEANELSQNADKKYGLFSSKKRKEVNNKLAGLKSLQNTMANIADTATDQRNYVQSMGEQAGLAYSMMTDGGYNQKYTYAAKQGGKLQNGGLLDFTTSMIPVVSTIKDVRNFIKNPNGSNFGSMMLSGVGDLLTVTGVGAGPGMALKAARTADKFNDVRKIAKSIRTLPGFHLKGLAKGSVLEKSVSKSGKIHINAINDYLKNASKLEQELFKDVLNTQFKNDKIIDYNDFRKSVQTKLTQLNKQSDHRYQSYGIDRLGFNKPETVHTPSKEIDTKTYVFSSDNIPKGHSQHYNDNVLMHSRTFIDPKDPDILYVMENQSDWSRFTSKINNSNHEQYLKKNFDERLIHENIKIALENKQSVLRFPTVETAAKIQGFKKEKRVVNESIQNQIAELDNKLGELWEKYFNSGDPRAFASESSVMLDGINELFPEYKIIDENLKKLENSQYDYFDEMKSVLKKYSDFPKLWKKLFKTDVKIVQDSKNNSWYEVKIPDDYLIKEWLYKQGGILELEPYIKLEWEPQIEINWELPTFKEGGNIDIVEELEWIPEFKDGGKTKDSDISEIEETSQKNVIPEGALHKNKHHMLHAEGLTKKGIPVIDDNGEQQAEIEHSEIIFTLEVTKKLEEYYKIFYSDESSNKEKELAALDAGKLLVYQILENTEDRTGLIESCKKGGTLTIKESEVVEDLLDWMPTIMIVEEIKEEIEEEKPKKKSELEKDDLKELIKDVIREALVELLIK